METKLKSNLTHRFNDECLIMCRKNYALGVTYVSNLFVKL